MNEAETAISHLQQAYRLAVHGKDVAAFMRLYDPAVRVFDAWGVWQYEGALAWRKMVESWFFSLGDERVEVTFEETHVEGTPEYCFASAMVTYAAVSSTGERLRSMQNRLTWGVRQNDQIGVILHEHTSAPISNEDMKAMLQRPSPA